MQITVHDQVVTGYVDFPSGRREAIRLLVDSGEIEITRLMALPRDHAMVKLTLACISEAIIKAELIAA